MKRRLIITVIVLILACSTLLALCACDVVSFITKNDERNMKQVVATVSYADRVSTISKAKIADTFNTEISQGISYGYYYMAYQGWSAEKSFEAIAETLANSALYNLFLIEEYNTALTKSGITLKYSTKGLKTVTEEQRAKELEEILFYTDSAELRSSIDATNKTFESVFDSTLEDIKKDRELANTVIEENVVEREKQEKPTNVTLKSISVAANGTFSVHLDDQNKAPENLLAYYVEQEFDTDDIIVTAHFVDKDDETQTHDWVVPYTDYKVEDYSSTTAKEALKLTVIYEKKSANIYVDIVAKITARKAKPVEEEDEETKYDKADTNGFSYDSYAPVLFDKKYFNAVDEKKLDLDEKEAFNDIKKTLSDNFRTYDYYLLQNYESTLSELNKTRLVDEHKAANENAIDKLVLAEYKKLLQKNIETYAGDSSAFKTNLGSDISSMVNYKESDYYYVKHILLSFSEEQKALFADFEALKVASEEEVHEYRDSLIDADDGIRVNVSNPDYKGTDEDAVCEDENCQCVACKNYIAPKDADGNPINEGHVCKDEDCICPLCENNIYSEKDVPWRTILARIQDDLNDVNSMYTDENERIQKLIETIDNWTYLVNDDTGSFDKIDAKTPGYLMVPVGGDSGMVAEFEELAEKLYADYKAGIATSDSIASCQFCVTDYGVHIMFFITEALDDSIATVDVPDVDTALDGNFLVSEIDNIDGYVVGLDYVIDVNTGKTLRESITEIVEENLLNELLIGDKKSFYEKNYEGSVTFDKDVYSDLAEQAELMYSQAA